MVWASRRTALPNPDDWKKILREDGYRRLEEDEHIAVGDIAIYLDATRDDSEILHVARICQLKSIVLDTFGNVGPKQIPFALSKWDLTLGESIHAIDDVFLNGGERVKSVIYTDRPKNEKQVIS